MTDNINPDAETVTQQINVTLRCEKCGSDELTIPDSPNIHVICSACSADCGRWGDIQTAMNEAVAEGFTKSLKDTLGETLDGSDGVVFFEKGE